MILDCQPAVAAERRRAAAAIPMIRPMRTRAPRTIHSQMSELVPLLDAGEPLGWATGTDAAALWVADGWAVGVAGTLVLGRMLGVALGRMLGVALGRMLGGALGRMLAAPPDGTLMLRLGVSWAIGLPLPHPATEHAATPIAAARSRPPAKRRMPDPSVMKSNLSQDVV